MKLRRLVLVPVATLVLASSVAAATADPSPGARHVQRGDQGCSSGAHTLSHLDGTAAHASPSRGW